jgi:TldD protein
MDRELILDLINKKSDYLELRLQENRSENITMINGDLTVNSISKNQGLSVRAHKKGVWGFSSTNLLSVEKVDACLNEAIQNAIFLSSKSGAAKACGLPVESFSSNHDFSTSKNRWSDKEKVEFIKEVDCLIEKYFKNLKSRTVIIRNLDMQKELFLMNQGRHFSMITRSHVIYILNAEDRDGFPIEVLGFAGNLGQIEDCFSAPEELLPLIQADYEHLMNKKSAVHAGAGVREVVLASKLAGILAHEAIGHTTEADIVLGGSVASDYVGQKVASELVTLTDFAHTLNGENLPVPVYVDDEGTKAHDRVLIENGVLKGFMHNKETAQYFDDKPTGNARAYEYSDEPLIRMRNTAILPGESQLEDMIASIENGYYLLQPSNGQADSTSEFMFGVPVGYEVKNGKIGRAIKSTTISGVAFDLLKTVSMVSNEMHWDNLGFCGKKQLIPVGMGGPAIKCQVNIGGE